MSIAVRRALLVLLLCLPIALHTQAGSSEPVVAWTLNGTLHLWRDGTAVMLAADNAAAPYLSTDGTQVAYTAGEEWLPLSLWLAESSGNAQILVTNEQVGGGFIDQVVWVGNDSLYFNTSVVDDPLAISPRNDLYRVDINSGELVQMLPPGAGGAISASPDGQTLALVFPGRYNESGEPIEDGGVRLLDVTTGDLRQVFSFTPVSTGSPNLYYPQVYWQADSSAFMIAVPPPELLFNGDESTALWRIERDGNAANIGSVPAGYYGQPAWSADGQYLAYGMTPPSVQQDGQVYLANGDGANAELLFSASTAYIEWSQHGQRFIHGDGITLNVGDVSNPTRLSIPALYFDADLLTDDLVIYTAVDGERLVLRLGNISENGETITITDLAEGTLDTILAYDAVIPR